MRAYPRDLLISFYPTRTDCKQKIAAPRGNVIMLRLVMADMGGRRPAADRKPRLPLNRFSRLDPEHPISSSTQIMQLFLAPWAGSIGTGEYGTPESALDILSTYTSETYSSASTGSGGQIGGSAVRFCGGEDGKTDGFLGVGGDSSSSIVRRRSSGIPRPSMATTSGSASRRRSGPVRAGGAPSVLRARPGRIGRGSLKISGRNRR